MRVHLKDQTQYQLSSQISNAPEIFPSASSRFNVSAEPLPASEYDTAIRIITLAQSKYPAELLKKSLETVYLVGDLHFRGITASGTNSLRSVYVVGQGMAGRFSDAYIEMTFHSELSSIFLRNYATSFPKEAWMAVNPESFQYGTDGTNAVQNSTASVILSDAHAPEGFVCQYATASLEEDFNQI